MKLWEYLTTPETSGMTRDALLAGLCIVVMCGVMSPLVVVKRLGFVGQGVSHSAFGGVGLASILAAAGLIGQGTPAEFGVIMLFCIVSAVAMARISDRRTLPEDSAIGMVLVGTMALGAILVQLSPAVASSTGARFTPQGWENILFGSILMAGGRDVAIAATLAAVVVIAVWLVRRPMMFFAFDEDASRAFGVPGARMRVLLMVLLALAVVTAMKVAGVVLATALLVFPGATALRVSERLWTVVAISVGTAVLSLIAGLALALELNWQGGPSIVLAMGLLFGASWFWGVIQRRSVLA